MHSGLKHSGTLNNTISIVDNTVKVRYILHIIFVTCSHLHWDHVIIFKHTFLTDEAGCKKAAEITLPSVISIHLCT